MTEPGPSKLEAQLEELIQRAVTTESFTAFKARIEDLQRKFPVGSTVASGRWVVKIVGHRQPDPTSWGDGFCPFLGNRWIESGGRWSHAVTHLGSHLRAAASPEES